METSIIEVKVIVKVTYPIIILHTQGKPSRNLDTIPTVNISAVQGSNARRNTANDNFFSFTMSRPRPALVRMTVRAIFLKRTSQRYSERNI